MHTATAPLAARPPLQSPISAVVAVIDPALPREATLVPASVLTSWFGARLHLVTTDADDLDGLERVGASLGIPVAKARLAGSNLGETLAAIEAAAGPCVLVAPSTAAGAALAAQSALSTYLVPADGLWRLPLGPMVVPLTGQPEDLDALAVAAVWAQRLDVSVRLAVEPADPAPMIEEHVRRLQAMGVEVAVDGDEQPGASSVEIATFRRATAVVAPHASDRRDDLAQAASAAGVPLLTAPLGARAEVEEATPSVPAERTTAPIHKMSREECERELARHSFGRIGYLDDGLAMIAPVNYRFHDGAVYLRSLRGGKLAAAHGRNVVCLEIDEANTEERCGWSVVTHGHLEWITDPAVLRTAWAADVDPWVEADEWQWLRIVPISMSGRRVSGDAA